MHEIYKYLKLSPENEIESYETFYKILFMNHKYTGDEILSFYLNHKNHAEKMKYKGKETISLRDIMLESEYYEEIINHTNTYQNDNVIDYWVRNFDKFKIKHFVCSDTYQAIILDTIVVTKKQTMLFILILNSFYDYINVEKMVKKLPKRDLVNVKLNSFTFESIIAYGDLDIMTQLMVYPITDFREIECIIKKLKDPLFYSAIVKHLVSQQIINDTMLAIALLIKDGLYELDIRNVCLKNILDVFSKREYLFFDNKHYKKLLLIHTMTFQFDIELFIFSVSQNTKIKYADLKSIVIDDFTPKDIYILYFYRKYHITEDKQKLKPDIQEIITNKLYDTDTLEFIIKNNLDFQLFSEAEVRALESVVEVHDILSTKYPRIILNSSVMIKSATLDLYSKVLDNVENTADRLPIMTNTSGLDDTQYLKLILNYIKFYEINLIIELLIERRIENDKVIKYLTDNFKKIKRPIYRLLAIDAYDLHNMNTDLLIKMKPSEKLEFLEQCKDVKQFIYYFHVNSNLNLCVSQKAYNIYLENNPDYLQMLNMLENSRVNENFMFYFLSSLFSSDIDPSNILSSIVKIYELIDYSKKIISCCANYFITILSNDEFIQTHDMTSARDFLHIIYMHMKKHGKDKSLFIQCEKIVNCLKSLIVFFDCEIIMRNIKCITGQ